MFISKTVTCIHGARWGLCFWNMGPQLPKKIQGTLTWTYRHRSTFVATTDVRSAGSATSRCCKPFHNANPTHCHCSLLEWSQYPEITLNLLELATPCCFEAWVSLSRHLVKQLV